jgi:hypothetical protein
MSKENTVVEEFIEEYFFYNEKNDFTFTIEASSQEKAYNKAYDTHGPQVEDMLYHVIEDDCRNYPN